MDKKSGRAISGKMLIDMSKIEGEPEPNNTIMVYYFKDDGERGYKSFDFRPGKMKPLSEIRRLNELINYKGPSYKDAFKDALKFYNSLDLDPLPDRIKPTGRML
jgi:hypothetical protein